MTDDEIDEMSGHVGSFMVKCDIVDGEHKCFWGTEIASVVEWQEIPKWLYLSLIGYEKVR